jgi:hypothetical protein
VPSVPSVVPVPSVVSVVSVQQPYPRSTLFKRDIAENYNSFNFKISVEFYFNLMDILIK